MTHVLTVVGARPQFVKAAPVSRALSAARLRETLVHTGQHFDPEMSAVFFGELALPEPAHRLDIHGGGHGEMTGRMLIALERVMLAEAPDLVLIYGDTNSTLAGALAAAKLGIPVAHVEAGLRSFNRAMPEELNRIVADRLSRLLFCPTEAAVANLGREGIREGVHAVGDVMYDAALLLAEPARRRSRILDRLGLAAKGYAVATLHRAENTDDPGRLKSALDYLRRRAHELPVVLPVHPRLAQAAARAGEPLDAFVATEPLGYLDMLRLTAEAALVLTDSGGLQKEAYFHRVPCVTLRGETEWVETIECGWNRLWTVADYAPRRAIADYGDGHAAERIVAIVAAACLG